MHIHKTSKKWISRQWKGKYFKFIAKWLLLAKYYYLDDFYFDHYIVLMVNVTILWCNEFTCKYTFLLVIFVIISALNVPVGHYFINECSKDIF